MHHIPRITAMAEGITVSDADPEGWTLPRVDVLLLRNTAGWSKVVSQPPGTTSRPWLADASSTSDSRRSLLLTFISPIQCTESAELMQHLPGTLTPPHPWLYEAMAPICGDLCMKNLERACLTNERLNNAK